MGPWAVANASRMEAGAQIPSRLSSIWSDARGLEGSKVRQYLKGHLACYLILPGDALNYT